MKGAMMSYLDHVDALMARGDLIGASRTLDANQAVHSGSPRALIAMSRLLRLRGRHAEALELLERLASSDPQNTLVLGELGRVLQASGDFVAANAWYERAYCDAAKGEDWVLDWIDALFQLRKIDVGCQIAKAYCDRVPGRAIGWFRLGLGHQLVRQYPQALDAYGRAMQIEPTLPMLRNNMGAAHMELQAYDVAQALLEQALADQPDNALAWTNLATLLLKRKDIAASQLAAERACTLAPNYALALQTYSYVLKELQRWQAAELAAQRAHEVEPSEALTWSLAMLQLLRGDYANGWPNHEARWSAPELKGKLPTLPAPRWEGEPLKGKTLFVWSEQGYGDALQFVQCVPLIADRVRREGGKLVYSCFSGVFSLFLRSLRDLRDVLIVDDKQFPLPEFDYHLPLCSVPLKLGIGLEDLPISSSYLEADPAHVEGWRARCSPAGERFKVGLVWSGSRTHQRNPFRAVDPLDYARAFAGIPNVEFFSLQVDGANEADAARAAGLRLTDYTGELKSFDDTAALIRSLDLVITVCTSVAHLAGGLGVPAWVLLDVNPHWVWMTGRDDSPWYPGVKLYRQREYGHWEPVLARVAQDLAAFAGSVVEQRGASFEMAGGLG